MFEVISLHVEDYYFVCWTWSLCMFKMISLHVGGDLFTCWRWSLLCFWSLHVNISSHLLLRWSLCMLVSTRLCARTGQCSNLEYIFFQMIIVFKNFQIKVYAKYRYFLKLKHWNIIPSQLKRGRKRNSKEYDIGKLFFKFSFKILKIKLLEYLQKS